MIMPFRQRIQHFVSLICATATLHASVSLAWQPNDIVASSPGSDRKWQAESSLQFENEGRISTAAISSDSQLLACGVSYWSRPFKAQTSGVKIWDLRSGQQKAWIPNLVLPISTLNFRPDGRRLLITFEGPERELLFVSGRRYLFTDRVARLWDLSQGRELAVLRGHEEKLLSASFTPDGQRILTVARNGFRVWDSDTGDALFAVRTMGSSLHGGFFFRASPDAPPTIAIIPAGSVQWTEYTKSAESEVDISYQAERFPLRTLRENSPGDALQSDSLGGSSRQDYVGLTELATFWDVKSGKKTAAIGLKLSERFANDVIRQVQALALSPDGHTILVAGVAAAGEPPSQNVATWNVRSRKVQSTLRDCPTVYNANFRPHRTQVLTIHWDAAPTLWNTVSGKRIGSLRECPGTPVIATFSPDGRWIGVGLTDGVVRLYDADSLRPVCEFSSLTQPIRTIHFSRDGSRLIAASENGEVRVWDQGARNK